MLYFLSKNRHPLQHISSGRLQARDNFIHTRRILDTFVILVGIQGTLYITQDDREFELNPNEYVILYPGHIHFGHKPSEHDLSYFWCHFKLTAHRYELLTEVELSQHTFLLQQEGISNSEIGDFYIIPEHGTLASADRAILIFRQLLDIANRKCYSPRLANYTLSLLAMEISQEYIDTNLHNTDGSKVHYNIAEIVEWIRANYNDDLTVKKIADVFNYNPDYLSATFKKYTGLSLLKYINKTKISAAKTFLLDSKTPIKEVALKAGFHDEKHFMKLFKQLEDMTPSQYRNAFYRQHLNRE